MARFFPIPEAVPVMVTNLFGKSISNFDPNHLESKLSNGVEDLHEGECRRLYELYKLLESKCSPSAPNNLCDPLQEILFDPCGCPMEAGEYSVCNICPGGGYPLRPDTRVDIKPLGTRTCHELYWLGNTHHIHENLCNPLQEILVDPCGCPEP